MESREYALASYPTFRGKGCTTSRLGLEDVYGSNDRGASCGLGNKRKAQHCSNNKTARHRATLQRSSNRMATRAARRTIREQVGIIANRSRVKEGHLLANNMTSRDAILKTCASGKEDSSATASRDQRNIAMESRKISRTKAGEPTRKNQRSHDDIAE